MRGCPQDPLLDSSWDYHPSAVGQKMTQACRPDFPVKGGNWICFRVLSKAKIRLLED
jgi:hypothetical protein